MKIIFILECASNSTETSKIEFQNKKAHTKYSPVDAVPSISNVGKYAKQTPGEESENMLTFLGLVFWYWTLKLQNTYQPI